MKFKVITFGCKVNTYESTYIEEKFIKEGYVEALNLSDADVIVVNTCSVTNTSDTKCKKYIRRIKRENPKATLIACGCSVQNNFEDYKSYGIDIIVGTSSKAEIPELYKEFLKNKKPIYKFDSNRKKSFENMNLEKFTKHTRAFVKVQDGCDNFCSYCCIPLVRGSIRSKEFNEAAAEINTLANNNHKEIVLVGIHTGSYNSNGKDLFDLIDEISKNDNIKRIRISSIEITELNDKFLKLLKNNERIVSHMHIPLQAGSNNVLKLMNRKYDLKYFEDKIKEIRTVRPDINITTDIIVGHPGETDDDFNSTLEFSRKMKFGKIHVFPYSERANTKASLMDNKVDEKTKKDRADKLLRLSDILEDEYESKFIGKTLNIITEENHQGEIVGFTDNYIKVTLTSNDVNINELIKVKLENKKDGTIYASKVMEEE